MRRSIVRVFSAAAPAVALLLVLGAGGCGTEDGEGPRAVPAAEEQAELPAGLHPELLAAQEALEAREIGEARRHLEAVPPDDPSYLIALSNLTTVYAALGELESALETYRRLAELKSDDPKVFLGQGWVEYQLGHLEGAELCALRAIELAPEDPEARYNVAFFRLAQGRLPLAVVSYHRAMLRDVGMPYVATARGNLLRLQEERPDFPDVHYALAYFANSLGNRRDEVEELERYLAMDPVGPAVEVARSRLAEAREAISTGP